MAMTLSRLTSDPAYNVMLGSAYFQRLVSQWDGSYPLAVASYNAGAGNVRKWVRAYGDPRAPGGDIIGWIERIPFEETRGYVQRVLENSVVYDRLNPTAHRAAPGPSVDLSGQVAAGLMRDDDGGAPAALHHARRLRRDPRRI